MLENENPGALAAARAEIPCVHSQRTQEEIAERTPLAQEKIAAPTLRDYQQRGVDDIRAAFRAGVARACFTMPTGAGKTILFSYMVAGAAARGKRVLLLAHRIELVEQIGSALARQGVAHGLITAEAPESEHPVQVASIATLGRRLDRWRDRFDLIVIDEAHHSVAGSWAAVVASQAFAKVLGVTATPERLDGRGLSEIFDVLIEGPSVAALIAAGWLVPCVVYAPEASPDLTGVRTRAGDFAADDLRERMGGVVISAAVAEYLRICRDARIIVFCVDIEHSRDVTAAFLAAGIPSAHVDGETPAGARHAILAAFARGEIHVLCNVSLFGEGFDLPALDGVVMLRPTQSIGLYLQMAGRALRPSPGKQHAVILDFAGNSLRHGLPDAPRQWSLDAKPRRQRAQHDGQAVRRCTACGAVNARHLQTCAHCGADLRTAQERREIEVRLAATERDALAEQIRRWSYSCRLRWAGADDVRLRIVATSCGYKPGWVAKALAEIRGAA